MISRNNSPPATAINPNDKQAIYYHQAASDENSHEANTIVQIIQTHPEQYKLEGSEKLRFTLSDHTLSGKLSSLDKIFQYIQVTKTHSSSRC